METATGSFSENIWLALASGDVAVARTTYAGAKRPNNPHRTPRSQTKIPPLRRSPKKFNEFLYLSILSTTGFESGNETKDACVRRRVVLSIINKCANMLYLLNLNHTK